MTMEIASTTLTVVQPTAVKTMSAGMGIVQTVFEFDDGILTHAVIVMLIVAVPEQAIHLGD